MDNTILLAQNLATGVAEITGTWCVLSVAPQRESRIAGLLTDLGIGHYLPQVKVKRVYASKKVVVNKPIYEGYLFACYGNEYERGLILDLKPRPEILAVHAHDQESLVAQLIGLEQVLAHDPWLDVVDWQQDGRDVEVIRGPMLGTRGKIIKRRGRDLLLVGVIMMGQCVELEIDPLDVAPAN